MRSPAAAILGAVFLLSELLLALAKRSKQGSVSRDRGSLGMLWAVIMACVLLANAVAYAVPQTQSALLHRGRLLGVALVIGGLALRWYSILHLGRFFTVNVAIASGQKVVETGPYRWVRHPSYSGALAAFLGLGICSENWLSLAVLFLPIAWAFRCRIAVEEVALLEGLGDPYRAYAARTRRLVPWIY